MTDRLTDAELDALGRDSRWDTRYGERAIAELRALRDENAALVAIRDAADRFALAWAGEQAARSAGMPLLGFPVVDAYQSLLILLSDDAALASATVAEHECSEYQASVCCGAGQFPDIEGLCGGCREWTGFECRVCGDATFEQVIGGRA